MPVVPMAEKYTGFLREVIRYINQYGIQDWSIRELAGGVGGWLGITGPIRIAGMEFVNLPMSVYIKKTDDSMYWISENSYPQGWKGYDWLDFVANLSNSPHVKEVGIIEETVTGGYVPPLGAVAVGSPGELMTIAYTAPTTPVPPTSPSPPIDRYTLPATWPYYVAFAGLGILGLLIFVSLLRRLTE